MSVYRSNDRARATKFVQLSPVVDDRFLPIVRYKNSADGCTSVAAVHRQQMVTVMAYLVAGGVRIFENFRPLSCHNFVNRSADGFTTKRFIRKERPTVFR